MLIMLKRLLNILIIFYFVFFPFFSEARRIKENPSVELSIPATYEVHFDKKSHSYTINGEKFPSVHAILNLLNKPALIPWAIKTVIAYLAEHHITPNPADYYSYYKHALGKRDRTAAIGTEVHSFISEILTRQQRTPSQSQGNSGEPHSNHTAVDKEESDLARVAFEKWFSATKPTLVASEAIVISPTYKYAGTFDALCLIDGELWLIDFKTTKGIYDDHILQISAYRQAIEEMGGYWVLSGDKYVFHSLEGKKISRMGIVRLDKNTGEYELRPISEEEYAVVINKFLLLSRFYNLHSPEDIPRFGVISATQEKPTAETIFDNLLEFVIQAMRICGATEQEIIKYIEEQPYFFFLPEVRAILPSAIMALKEHGIEKFSEQWEIFKEIIENTSHRDVKYSATFLQVLTDRLSKGDKLEDILKDFRDMWHFGFVWATRFSQKTWEQLIANRRYLEEKLEKGIPLSYDRPLAIQIYPVSDYNDAFNSDLETTALIEHGFFVLYYEVDNLFELLKALAESTDPQNGVKASIICLNGHGNPEEVGEFISGLSDLRLLEKFGVRECLADGGTIILYSCNTGVRGGIISALFTLFPQAKYIYAPTGEPNALRINFGREGEIVDVEYEGSEVYDLFREPMYRKPTPEDIEREIKLYCTLSGIDLGKIDMSKLVEEIKKEVELQFYLRGYIIYADYLSIICKACDKYR